MPFIEVLGFEREERVQHEAGAAMTEALSSAWNISPNIVSTYFVALPENGYTHAGQEEQVIQKRRVFVKLHAFPRSREQRQSAAAGVTAALASSFKVDPALIAIYFFDREPSHVAHGGDLNDG